MERAQHIDNESGIALVIALVVLLALTVMGISAMTTTTLDIKMSGNERRAAETLQIADSGIERGFLDLLTDFNSDKDWSNDEFKWRSDGTEHDDATFFQGATFGTFPSDDDWGTQWGLPFSVADVTGPIGSATDLYGGSIEFGGGRYRVLLMREAGNADEVYLRSYAEHSTGARKIIEVHIEVNKVDAWQNIVFAGRGSETAAITGNITVGGSVHVLGTGAVNEWTFKGTAKITNGYGDLANADIRNRILIDSLERVGTYDGKPVYSLESVFRVKNVQVVVDGNATVGEVGDNNTDWNGDGEDDLIYDSDLDIYYKAELDGIYANKQIAGDYYASDVAMPDGYDLGDKYQLPVFSEAYDPETQTSLTGKTCADLGLACTTYRDYVQKMSVDVDGAANPERCTLTPGVTADFEVGTFDGGGNCIDEYGCLKWVSNPGNDGDGKQLPHMTIEGRVEFTGCGEAGVAMTAVTYEGKGILYTAGDITLDAGLLNYAGNKFVRDDLLAVMTESNILMAQATSGDFMGAFYATKMITMDKNGNLVIGSMVSNLFCLAGTVVVDGETVCKDVSGVGNAADIFHVPGISDALTEMGMLKGNTVYTFKSYSWVEKY